ncbi:MAG: hypothetical protein ABGY96_05215 [bacterium]|nr:hypothetical protein [Gammaproteobacteria bacterium]HIL94715.1 hypothetical protein [Pseudomonadales bacterium]
MTSLPQALNDLLLRCLSEDRVARPGNGADLLTQFNAARRVAATVDGADSKTWIGESGETGFRTELKPLKKEIGELLKKYVVIDPHQREKLDFMATVIDLDHDGLDELIKNEESELGPSLRLKRNFLKLLDETVSTRLTPVHREMLHKSSAPTGWSTQHIDKQAADWFSHRRDGIRVFSQW